MWEIVSNSDMNNELQDIIENIENSELENLDSSSS
jgi:hypothetical protein